MRKPQEPRDAVGGHLDEEALSDCAFSPELAAPGALEHAGGCAACSARIGELSRVLAALADLPEPEIPEAVLIRLDATVEQAWQEADAEAMREARGTRPRRHAKLWKRLTVSVTALGVLAGAAVGVGTLVHEGSSSTSTAGAASSEARVPGLASSSLTSMARQALEKYPYGNNVGSTVGVPPATAHPMTPTNGVLPDSGTAGRPLANCFHAPARAGYTVVAAAAEKAAGGPASLVVYRNDEEPASTTTFYAVLYAGSCPSVSSEVLAQGLVFISR